MLKFVQLRVGLDDGIDSSRGRVKYGWSERSARRHALSLRSSARLSRKILRWRANIRLGIGHIRIKVSL
jgi:hypothetical protein